MLMSFSDIFAGPIAFPFVAVHGGVFISGEVGSGYWQD